MIFIVKRLYKKHAKRIRNASNKIREEYFRNPLAFDKHAKKFKQTTNQLRKEYRKNITTAVLTGLAFIIGLYVKDLITVWLDFLLNFFNLNEGTDLLSRTIVTLVVVGIAILFVVIVSKWSEK